MLVPSPIHPSLQVINLTSSPGSMDLLKTLRILLTIYRLMKEWQAPLIMLVLWRIVIVGVRNCKLVDKGRDCGCGIIERVQEDAGNIDHQFPHVGITILSQPSDELSSLLQLANSPSTISMTTSFTFPQIVSTSPILQIGLQHRSRIRES